MLRQVKGNLLRNGKKRTDLFLIYPPWAALGRDTYLQNFLPPLGILTIAAYAESKGYSAHVFDIHGERADDLELRRRLRLTRPRFIGISVLTNMCIPAHKIAKICKEEMPDCTLVVGGVHAEAMPEQMLKNSSIDCVVRGDGENGMISIMQEKNFKNVAGVSYFDNGKIVHNPAAKVQMDLDIYPQPAYHLVDFSNYFPPVGTYRKFPAINMLMTRGCPGKCTFCNSAMTTLRASSPARIVEQIKNLYHNYGIRQIMFYDDTFTVLKKVCLEFCELLEKEKLDLSYVAYVRGDCLGKELAAAMKRSGCHQVLMGIETGSPEIAKRIGKPIEKEKYKESVRIAHENGLEVRGSFIIGNLGETQKTMEDTLNFAIDLDIDFMQLNISTPYPGTALYKELSEKNMLRHHDWSIYGQQEIVYDQENLTDEEIYNFRNHAYRKFYLRPKPIFRLLKRITVPRLVRDYFVTAKLLLFSVRHVKTKDKWNCWSNLTEEDFFDREVGESEYSRLTYELRQEKFVV
jgi:radical SAM superfamily enzyme YgiQ (UPF0313 family)